uniref:Uncharacterized protein n=1 Tax=Steinernema glaseri TaxID=37863 RepID=A0A1I8ADU1_9BILA
MEEYVDKINSFGLDLSIVRTSNFVIHDLRRLFLQLHLKYRSKFPP